MQRWLLSLGLVALASAALAQPRSAPPGDGASAELRGIEIRLADVQRELDRSRDHADRELGRAVDSMKTRFDDALAATHWALGLLTLIAAVGSMSWWASHKDGARLLKEQIENLQEIRRVIGTSQADAAALLDQQIRSMDAVRNVIEFVQGGLALQTKGEERLQAAMTIISDLHDHFEQAYRSVRESILTLASVSRMGWANLSVFQATLAASARAEFRSIPPSVLESVQKNDPHEFAQVCELLGASAFYANDIAHAVQLLGLAERKYAAAPERADDVGPKAATFYFQALIAKSWADGTESVGDALRRAKNKLQVASDRLAHRVGEFLVPVTLAEIESYLRPVSAEARERIDKVVRDLEAVPARNENQARLLVRAWLLRGNIDPGDAGARQAYERALSHDPESPYAMLSIALSCADGHEREDWFTRGLQALRETRMLEKHEFTTRATALSWAVIAARELGDRGEESYRRELESIAAAAVNTGGRVPLFFSPVTKQPCKFEELLLDVTRHVRGQVPPRPLLEGALAGVAGFAPQVV